jgi:hypothetical protein
MDLRSGMGECSSKLPVHRASSIEHRASHLPVFLTSRKFVTSVDEMDEMDERRNGPEGGSFRDIHFANFCPFRPSNSIPLPAHDVKIPKQLALQLFPP